MVRVSDGRVVRLWEAGTNGIPGPVQVILELAEKVPAARRILLEPFQKDVARAV